MINRVILVGRLTKDPEYRENRNGVGVATFTLAINRPFTNAQGEREADFINVVVFKRQAENVSQYLFKGNLTGVDGRIQSRSYENQEGRRIFVTEVVADSVQFLEPKNSNGGQQDTYQQQIQSQPQRDQNTKPQGQNPFANANGPIDIDDEDLPF